MNTGTGNQPGTEMLANAIDIFVGATSHATGDLVNRVSRGFGSSLQERLKEAVSPDALDTVLRAEKFRETGLAHARGGNLDEAERLVSRARSVSDEGGLAGEARAAAEMFQLAAESYCKYRRRRGDEARADLVGSMSLTLQLADLGYRMDYRLVHLARNAIHVENLLGSKTRAWGQALELGVFSEGHPESWPFAQELHCSRRLELSTEERQLALDEIIGELETSFLGERDRKNLVSETDCRMNPFLQEWLHSVSALRNGQPLRFLRLVVEECKNYSEMPLTSRFIRSFLARLCFGLGQKELVPRLHAPQAPRSDMRG